MKKPPNILWIVSDAMRYDHLSCYGYERCTTPHLEVLAERATVYENAIAPAAWSLPSYATLLTGLYPNQHGVNSDREKLSESIPTLPERLREMFGYNSACFTANVFVTPDFGLVRGFQEYRIYGGPPKWGRFKGTRHKWKQFFGLRDDGAQAIISAAKRFISRVHEPWFILLVLMEVHDPYGPPLPWAIQAEQGLRELITHPFFIRDIANLFNFLAKEPCSADWDRLIRMYDAGINYVDYRIGQLIRWLNNRALLDEVLLIISADHGEALGEQNKFHHAVIAEPLVHVPLIVKMPGQRHPERVRDVVEVRQVSTTLMAGKLIADGVPVVDYALAQHIGGEDRVKFTNAWQQFFYRKWQADRTANLVRTPEWEYIEYEDGTRELFHIQDDPAETTNLVNERPDIAEEMQNRLQTKLQDIEATAPDIQREYPDISPEVEQRLHDLGYM